jgi:hypothetical protein
VKRISKYVKPEVIASFFDVSTSPLVEAARDIPKLKIDHCQGLHFAFVSTEILLDKVV